MSFRGNPCMTSFPCSFKDNYSQNATEDLLLEEKRYNRYGMHDYTNILCGVKEETKAESPECEGFSTVFSQLELHPESKPTMFEFLEITPWRACTTLRAPHKACDVLCQKLDNSEHLKSENQIQRRSISTLEANVNSKKKGKPENLCTRPYSDSKLNENSRKALAFTFNSSRYKYSFMKDFKFCHFQNFSKYVSEYTETITLARLQEHYRQQNCCMGNAKAMTTRQWVSHNALRKRGKGGREVPATNSELVRRAREEKYYNAPLPSFGTSSLKVAGCCVHADHRKGRKTRTYRDGKGDDSMIIDDKIQMFCERLSTTKFCGKDDRRRFIHTSKIIPQTSNIRKLEIVARSTNSTSRKNLTTTTAQRAFRSWQDHAKFLRQFPSPKTVSRTQSVTKPAQFQEKVVDKKTSCADRSSDAQKILLEHGPDVVDKI